MKVYNLSESPSILSVYLSELRDEEVQKDAMRFRKNLKRISEIIAYEISKDLIYTSKNIRTPLQATKVQVLDEQPVLATILRAGIAMHEGLLEVFDHADSTFVSAYREEKGQTEEMVVHVEYISTPPLDNRVVILCDPMLATGTSMVSVYKALLKYGTPKRIIMAVTVATPDALDYLDKNIHEDFDVYCAAIDEGLNDAFYILPGLGDAGDLAYGKKL